METALETRILDATMRCAARWGMAKTTVDDIAREAGTSRATVYRTFASREAIIAATARREVSRFFAEAGERLAAADDLEDLLTAGIVEAARFVQGHEVFHYLLVHEPDSVMPLIAVHRLDGLYRAAAAFAAPRLSRFVPIEQAALTAEWVVRTVLSYILTPSSDFDLTDPADARRMASVFVVPVLSFNLANAPANA